jgi:S-methylmethionine-dependent homocysteine/selenocysteine methylase
MNSDHLQELKTLASKALKGRQQLERLHAQYISHQKNGSCTRAKTTTYNAKCSEIMENTVHPAEKELRRIFRFYVSPTSS